MTSNHPFKKNKQKNSFQKTPSPVTPYQEAAQIWDERIGSARTQAKNWRIVAILSLCLTLIVSIALAMLLPLKHYLLYIAEVSPQGAIINVSPLKPAIYNPTLAQKEYFAGQFVQLIREIPLDPVLAKKNWKSAYHFLTAYSSQQLSQMMKTNNPLKFLGKQTISVKIKSIHHITNQTLSVRWLETSVSTSGKVLSKKVWSGVFSIRVQAPTTQSEILNNPLGIYITDFNLKEAN